MTTHQDSEQRRKLLLATAAEWRDRLAGRYSQKRADVEYAIRYIVNPDRVVWHQDYSSLPGARRLRRLAGYEEVVPWPQPPKMPLSTRELPAFSRALGALPLIPHQIRGPAIDLFLPGAVRLAQLALLDFDQRISGEDSDRLEAERCIVGSLSMLAMVDGIVHVVDRPSSLFFDDNGLLHSPDAKTPSFGFPGFEVFHWHGTILPDDAHAYTMSDIIHIDDHRQRRAMINVYGVERFVKEMKRSRMWYRYDKSKWGKLGGFEWANDRYLVVEVKNATVLPDGTRPTYYLQVHPRLCPMITRPDGGVDLGTPQTLTALNAVASTFGMYGHDYANAKIKHS